MAFVKTGRVCRRQGTAPHGEFPDLGQSPTFPIAKRFLLRKSRSEATPDFAALIRFPSHTSARLTRATFPSHVRHNHPIVAITPMTYSSPPTKRPISLHRVVRSRGYIGRAVPLSDFLYRRPVLSNAQRTPLSHAARQIFRHHVAIQMRFARANLPRMPSLPPHAIIFTGVRLWEFAKRLGIPVRRFPQMQPVRQGYRCSQRHRRLCPAGRRPASGWSAI